MRRAHWTMILAIVATLPAAQGAWQIQTLDSGGMGTDVYSSILLDGSGSPHIVYRQVSSDSLRHVRRSGASWVWDTVATGGGSGYWPSLALGGDGYLRVSYCATDADDLMYGWWDGVDWHVSTADATGMSGWHSSLALDADDHPWIGYWRASAEDLMVTTFDDVSWDHMTVDSTGSVGAWCSLALDGAGSPHLSYHEGLPAQDLKYAYRVGSTWITETVLSSGQTGMGTAIAVDDTGRAHVIYRTAVGLFYGIKDSTWSFMGVEYDEDVSDSFDMVLDSAGYPHVSYSDGENLKYWRHGPSGWTKEVVDSDSGAGRYSSIALASGDVPHITYDHTGTYLKYARMVPDPTATPNPTTTPAPPTPTAPPTAVSSPTQLPSSGVRIELPTALVHPGDTFWVKGHLDNAVAPRTDVPVFFILGVFDHYWFWPSWAYYHPPDGVDVDFRLESVPLGSTEVEVIGAFTWPDTGSDATSDLYFYGAMLDETGQTIWGAMAAEPWGFGP